MKESMTDRNKAFHNLYWMSCSMRAELDRLLVMAKAYPHFQVILDEHYRPAVDSNMKHALNTAKAYARVREFPPTHVVEQLYVAAVQMLDKLDCIERDRLAAVRSGSSAAATAEQRRLGKLLEDFNVDVGEVNVPAREAIEGIRPHLHGDPDRPEASAPQKLIARWGRARACSVRRMQPLLDHRSC
jgi:hypothetical protein